jgi:glycine/D-amino acid oxidase-like deaminating enzyme
MPRANALGRRRTSLSPEKHVSFGPRTCQQFPGGPSAIGQALEPDLLLATGHYRNGVLLAPASAEWVVEQVERP